jgi:pimeloyl-ACP methyl ester carboxylesterase
VKERTVLIGEDPALVGIVTEPGSASDVECRPACLLLNAGLVHRVGPNRLHVRLARELAAAGFRACRFDLSGRGDSEVRRDGLAFLESSVAEIGTVMDYLGKTGSRRFVLMGICSGAVNALQLAAVDPRVAGCVAIDGPAYPTRRYYLRRYAQRARRLETWKNTFAGRNAIGRWLRGGGAPGEPASEDEFGNPFGEAKVPDRKAAETVLRDILGRGVQLFFVFTGSWSIYNYRDQLADAFPFIRQSGAVRVDYFPGADHTFTRLHNQQILVETVRDWLTRLYGSESADAAAHHELVHEHARAR